MLGRPRDGDERPCGVCGNTLRFDEHYIRWRGRVSTPDPAWICRCGQEVFVRRRPRSGSD